MEESMKVYTQAKEHKVKPNEVQVKLTKTSSYVSVILQLKTILISLTGAPHLTLTFTAVRKYGEVQVFKSDQRVEETKQPMCSSLKLL